MFSILRFTYEKMGVMKCLLIIAIVFVTFKGNAQQSKTTIRKGFAFGAAFGIANSSLQFPSKKQSSTDLGINWKVGYLLNPKLALLLNGSVSVYEYNGIGRPRKRDFGGVFPALQYWLHDKFWILAGVGLGTDAPIFYDLKQDNKDETKYYSGIGVISSLGYEFYRKKNFTLDLQVRLNYSKVNLPEGNINGLNTALLLGINFY